MAKENVRKFYEKLESSKELQEKLVKAQESYTGDKADREEVLEAVLLPIAKEAGYDFTAEELKAAEKELVVENGISEQELENVSGGTWSECCLIGGAAGGDALACMIKGIGAAGVSDGIGLAICYYVGIGLSTTD